MKDKILIAGHGGQGIVVAGSLIANTALVEGYHTTGMISYGAEMRGGSANSSVIISDSDISSPVVNKPDTALIMNSPSLEKYEERIAKNGLMIINSSVSKTEPKRDDLRIVKIEATKLATELGENRAANFIMVGAYLKERKILKIASALNTIKKVLPRADKKLQELNKKALQMGYGE